MIPLLGFTPDADPTKVGVITDAAMLIPTDRGMRAAPSAVSVGLPALADACRGAALVRKLNGTARLIAGTAAELYEAGASSWTDVSPTSHTLGADDRWSFAQMGDATLAATITSKIQRSLSGNFADIAAAPKARIIVSVAGFVIALHTDEATFGDSPDRWWCSAYLDETSWAPSVATQATTGRLIEGGGRITAAARLGDDLVVMKNRALFVGRYAGPPLAWGFQLVSSEIGCCGQDAVANIGNALVFMGDDDVFVFDGTRPVSIADGAVRRWLAERMSATHRFRASLMWDRKRSLVWVLFPSGSGGGAVDQALVWHAPTRRWGVAAYNVEAPVPFISAGITYDGGSPLIGTYDSGPAVPYDSPFWLPAAENVAVIDGTHTLATLSGAAGASSFTTGDIGDEAQYTLCDRLEVRYLQSPTSATCSGMLRDDSGAGVQAGSVAARSDGSFDMRQSARWHRFLVATTGECEFTAIRARLKPAGAR